MRRSIARQRQSRPKRRGPRASQACDACAIAKARCDNNETCQRCHRRRIPCIRPWLQAGDTASTTGTYWPQHKSTNQDRAESQQASYSAALDWLAQETGRCPQELRDLSRLDADFSFSNLDGMNYLADLMMQGSSQGMPDDSLETNDMIPLFPTADADLSACCFDPSSTTLPAPSTCHSPPAQSQSPEVLQAFENTVGRWDPDLEDHRAAEEKNLSLAHDLSWNEDHLSYPPLRLSGDQMSSQARDSLLTMILNTCEPTNIARIVSAFPPAGVLDRLLHRFYTTHALDEDTWIHIPTLVSTEMPPELLAACISSAAMRSSSSAIRVFGTALHAVLHPYLFHLFEKRIARTRQIQQIQALALFIHTGFWSGSKRRMEIAAAIVGAALTMLRSGCRYRASAYTDVVPDAAESGSILDKKWRHWVEEESWKRIVFHMHIHCSQESLATGTRTPLSYGELSASFPHNRVLWMAQTADQWKETYFRLEGYQERLSQKPCLRDYLANPRSLAAIPRLFDANLARLIVLHAITAMIKDHWQSHGTTITSDELHTMRVSLAAAETSHNRLVHILENIHHTHNDTITTTRSSSLSPPENSSSLLTAELLLMHHFTPFEEIEVVAGREGPNEAKATRPLLQEWCQSNQARRAVWHAGQVIRNLRTLAGESFTEFLAVAAYQASLCLYLYGIIAPTTTTQQDMPSTSADASGVVVVVDAADSLVAQRWIRLGRGVPVLQGVQLSSSPASSPSYNMGNCPLHAGGAVLLRIREVLLAKASQKKNILPLVAGICDLILALSSSKIDQR
ncbi:hypothetical protein BJY01DRAFT_262805 [Aspergillus pseudoustus]|uniref:Zn(2)-C6 fungal-type domain-containing protein n=1 Tax=Aspergillus pseudoustus TaxID=1810923 RepID=A0ABR4IBE6_9EURO